MNFLSFHQTLIYYADLLHKPEAKDDADMSQEEGSKRKAARQQLELSTSQQVQGSKLLQDAVENDLALLLGGDLIVTIEKVGPLLKPWTSNSCMLVP